MTLRLAANALILRRIGHFPRQSDQRVQPKAATPATSAPQAAIAAWGALVAGVAAFGCTLWSLWRGKWPILRKIRALAASLSVISGAGLLAQFNLLGMQF